MAIANEEEDPLVVVSLLVKIATWELVPIEPVCLKMNRIFKLNFHASINYINIIVIPNEDNLSRDLIPIQILEFAQNLHSILME